jgi:hypothetical protein
MYDFWVDPNGITCIPTFIQIRPAILEFESCRQTWSALCAFISCTSCKEHITTGSKSKFLCCEVANERITYKSICGKFPTSSKWEARAVNVTFIAQRNENYYSFIRVIMTAEKLIHVYALHILRSWPTCNVLSFISAAAHNTRRNTACDS